MARRLPWHSAQDGERVYHDNDDCTIGTGIHYYWLRHGSGGRPICQNCRSLNARAARAPEHLPATPDDVQGAA